ncbi:uncharacterized protein C5L36_0B03055 [Pichia kudriavzevii]|uniref:Small nuclear ribonucleoprotein Sm D2 n=1 Tax=Pichia kudriavzevii TaxID=4909 RepID=A0A2U9R1C7_PICKU|nr:uncharacterized protein C5L36_0B03055 [Pichia kudriavzevii]AWU75051.1 hypothetical protein C5L36_0B03055 [Pichia kudriavzevii]
MDAPDYEFSQGPLRLLATAVQQDKKVLVSLRNTHKLVASVKAFDKHCNMVLENVKEFWYDGEDGNKALRERYTAKMFLRGDSVVLVLHHE